jgi:hypothetical protein
MSQRRRRYLIVGKHLDVNVKANDGWIVEAPGEGLLNCALAQGRGADAGVKDDAGDTPPDPAACASTRHDWRWL